MGSTTPPPWPPPTWAWPWAGGAPTWPGRRPIWCSPTTPTPPSPWRWRVGAPSPRSSAAPFRPVHIVLLELFMDLGASVAFVSEPAAPGAMRRPPRDPAAHFLDRVEVSAILTAALALFGGVATSYFVVRGADGTAAGTAAAVAAWLVGHTVVAWALRARPGQSLRANPAFPAWALAAATTGVVLAGSPAGRLVGLEALSLPAWGVVMGSVAAMAVIAALGRRLLRLGASL